MQIKRIISLLLCLLMLVSMTMLASCNSSEEESSTDTSSEGEKKGEFLEDYVTMPEFKWSGTDYEEFRVAIYSNETQATYFCEDKYFLYPS